MVLTAAQQQAVNRASPQTRQRVRSNFVRQNNNGRRGNSSNMTRVGRRSVPKSQLNSGNATTLIPIRSQNISVNAPITAGVRFQSTNKTDIIVTKMAVLDNFIPSRLGVFIATAKILHPAIIPWIGSLADIYDKYSFVNLEVRYMPIVNTTASGNAFIAFDYDDHNAPAVSLTIAQEYDKFMMTPVWSTSPWISVPRQILQDKWYDCNLRDELEVGSDSFHDAAAARVIFGLANVAATPQGDDLPVLGRLEIKATVRFTRPTASRTKVVPSLTKTSTEEIEIVEEFEKIKI